MSIIFGLINYIEPFISVIAVMVLGLFIYRFIKVQNFEILCKGFQALFCSTGKIIAKILPFALILIVLAHPVTMQLVGLKNLELLDNGEYIFYIERNGNVYPALVKIEEMNEGDFGKSRTWREYRVLAIDYGVNVSGISETDESLVIGEPCWVYPKGKDYEDGYDIILLNKPAYSTKFEETNKIRPFQIITLLLEIAGLVIFYLLLTTDYEHRPVKKKIHDIFDSVKKEHPHPILFWKRLEEYLCQDLLEKDILKQSKEENKQIREIAWRLLLKCSIEYLSGTQLFLYQGEVQGHDKEILDIIAFCTDKLASYGYLTPQEQENFMDDIRAKYISQA